ncbi:MAG: terpene cyclase/mutase family protein [Planctomycetes bacterium]|nr:terpene cyclase/mutase family protein [Planctomycetota bacterium]
MDTTVRTSLRTLLAALLGFASGCDDGRPEPAASKTATAAPVVDLRDTLRRTEPMVAAGLARLAQAQHEDGSFYDAATREVRLGLSAIATLSLLADGNTEFRGRYADQVTRALGFLLSCRVAEGERLGYLSAEGDTTSRMHGHALATLALTQAYGMTGVKRRGAGTSDRLGQTIRDAVAIIVASQSPSGGWNYDPLDRLSDEGSLTVVMVQALRGAQNAGFTVSREVIDRALDYIRKSQNSDGSVRYRLQGSDQSSFELTAAACATLAFAGSYRDLAVRQARDHLWSQTFDTFLGPSAVFPWYGMYYAVLTLWFDYDHDRMSLYYPRIVDWYRQRYDPVTGGYEARSRIMNKEVVYGDLYRTAFATLTMQIPMGQLPIFER